MAWKLPIGRPNCTRSFGVGDRHVEGALGGANELDRDRGESVIADPADDGPPGTGSAEDVGCIERYIVQAHRAQAARRID